MFQQHLISNQHLLLLGLPVTVGILLLLSSLLSVLLSCLLVISAFGLLNNSRHLNSQLPVLKQLTGAFASAAVRRRPVHHQELLQLLLGVLLLSQGCVGDLHDGAHKLLCQTICLRVFWCALHRLEPRLLGVLPPVSTLIWTATIMNHLLWDALP